MRKKPLRRPVKSPGARRYRIAQQKKRLAELGLSAEKIKKMNTKDIRAVLRHPKKLSA
jgi:transposase-like protein